MAKTYEGDIAELWASGIYEKDSGKVAEAKDMLAEWNRKNPGTPIRIKMNQILRRVKQMKLTSRERLMKTTPKELRQYAADALN